MTFDQWMRENTPGDLTEREHDLLVKCWRAAQAADAERQSSYPGKCSHPLRLWSPLEGTIAGALAFRRDPAKHGFCEVCRAAGPAPGE